ncbi:MAG: pyridoxal phosphate-dependent aminotransferase [Bacteroidales bacterium]|nr:pyridoxal phosphate-dependent aminotransferase [Bacteroidales bacterium]
MNQNIDKMSPFMVMEVLERAQELECKGINVIHMEVGEPDFNVPHCVVNAVSRAMENGHTHYTHSLGNHNLREAIADLYAREYGTNFTADNVVVTSGSSPAILMVLQLLCNPGDEVIIFNPGYSCYRNFILAANAVPVEVKLNPDNGFKINIDDIKAKITAKTRAIFVTSPSNPLGCVIPGETLNAIANLGVTVISDEIYHGLVYSGKAHSILEYTSDAIVINGFSKRYAMTGLRLGYVVAPLKYMRKLQIMQQNLFICAPSISQEAGLEAIRSADQDVENMRITYDQRRKFMVENIRKIGLEISAEPEGAFYVFADARRYTNDSYRFAFDILENAHVGVTPGTDFGYQGQGFIRFSYANSLENIGEGLKRIDNYLKAKYNV